MVSGVGSLAANAQIVSVPDTICDPPLCINSMTQIKFTFGRTHLAARTSLPRLVTRFVTEREYDDSCTSGEKV